MQEAAKQREDRIIRKTIDNFTDNYRISKDDNERAKTDRAVKEFLSPLGPGRYEKFLGYYEKGKNGGISEIKLMYHLLEEMVEAAEEGDKDRVVELDRSYEALVPKVYHEPPTELESDYDNCRQSCVMSVGGILEGVLKGQHDELVADAKKRFSKIPEPDE